MLKLFTTSTCPNCKMAEKLLTENNINFEKIVCEENETTEKLANAYNIKQAPTLVLDSDERIVSLGPIRKWVLDNKKTNT